MQALLGDIAAGVLVNVITATGRWIAGSAASGRAGRDGDIAAWFDTYELVGSEDFPELPEVRGDAATTWLKRNDVHAVLHELLAIRITAGPESDTERLRGALRATARAAFKPVDSGRRRTGRLTSPAVEALADRVFDWADGEICTLAARLEARDPKRWRQARQDAFAARIVDVLNAIERHVSALEDQPDPETDAAWIARYRRQAIRAFGSIEPPDFARRRKVPIADLYVPPEIIEPGAVRDADGDLRTIGFGDLAARIDRTVLLGDPGGGKSTASRVLAHRWAQDPGTVVFEATEVRCPKCGGHFVDGFCDVCGDKAQSASASGEAPRFPARSWLPFLVVLREFAGADGPQRSVVEHIEERLNTFHQCAAPRGTVERLLLTGQAAVIFDGLDELIDTGRRVEVTRIVEQFCERFPLAPVMVTSRVVGYDEARLDDTQFDAYRIAGFTRDETATYVRNWFAQEDGVDVEEAERLADAFMRESDQVADLRSNPLMLALMCILYRGEGTLPRNRPGVYAECARMLFDRWDTRRGIHVDLQARNLIEPALRHIAYWLFTRTGPPEVTETEIIARVADLLHERGFEQRHDAEAAAGEFVRFCRGRAWILGDAGTTARGEALYTFTHRTFLEYFAAAYLASVTDTPEELARELGPRVAAGEWDVVGQLAVQIKDAGTDRGAERVLASLLADVDGPATFGDGSQDTAFLVAFAARCLDVAEVPPALVRKIAHLAVDHVSTESHYTLSYLPLWRDRIGDVIADAITERIGALFAADDPSQRRLGAYLSAYATFCAAENTNYPYWHRLERRLTGEYRDALIEMARTDDAVWMRLIDRGVITLAEALALRDNDLSVLFREIPVPIVVNGVHAWPPYIAEALYGESGRHAGLMTPDPDAAVDRCRAFGAALRGLPAPPWPAQYPSRSAVDLHTMFATEQLAPAERDVDGLCGAVVFSAVLSQLETEATMFPWSSSRVSPSQRAGFDALMDRIPEGSGWIRDLMDRWLNGEFDFIQWRHDDEPE